jgi:hypothetical protein
MAIATNTSTTYSSVAIREQLSDVIYNIAPLDTPFLNGCSKETADNTFFEWQVDTITAGAAGIKNVIKDCYDAGGSPDLILAPSAIKQAISDLAQSVSSLQTNTKGDAPAHVVAAVDVYVSDFGTFKILSDRNMNSTEHVFFLDMDFWSVAWLRPFQTVELAKTGDAVKQLLLAEYGLVSKNEKSSGILADAKA